MSLAQWSTTAASNANAADNINWAEGQAPSTVNNSARQEMADVADRFRNSLEWVDRNDTAAFSSGTKVIFTGVDLTGIYSVGRRIFTTSSTPGTLYGRITATAFSTNTTVTIAFDSTAVLANEAISDIAVGVIKNSTATSSLDAQNISRIDQFGIPTGMCMPYGSTASEPTGFAFCNGQALNRATEAGLFGVIGVSFGSSSTATFAVPDMRGRAIVCLDNLGGASANVLTSTAADTLGGTLGAESTSQAVTLTGSVSSHTLAVGEIPAPTFTILSRGAGNASVSNGDIASANTSGASGTIASTAISTNFGGGGHTHNDNFAVSSTDTVSVVQPSFAMPWIIKK